MNSKVAQQMNFTEYEECVRFANYLEVLMMSKKLRNYTHIPNETFTPYMSVKAKNKRMGVKNGFPDYVVIGMEKMVTIEMKRVKGGSVTPAQHVWITDLNHVGVPSFICKGFDEAKKVVEKYLL